MPASTPAGECSECRLPSGNHDSANHQRHDKKFRIRRLHVLAFLMWLLGVLLLFICSWPAYEFMIPEDRKVVSISEDGRYLATVRSPAKLVKTFSGRVEHKGDQPPQGPIEIWDARGGAVIHSIDCGTDIVGAVHLMDQGNLVVAAFPGESGPNSYVSTWRKGTTGPMKKVSPGILHSCADVDGTTIVVVWKESFTSLRVIDLRSRNDLSQFESIIPWKTLLTPDGTRVVAVDSRTESGHTIRVWDTINGNQIGSFLEPNWPKAFTLSPDLKTLWVVVADDGNSEASLQFHGWDIVSQQRHTSITPPYKSSSHATLMSAYKLTFLTPSLLQVQDSGVTRSVIRLNEESINVVDAGVSLGLFAKDGSLQVAMEYDPAGRYMLIVKRMVERGEVFRLPTRARLMGLSPDMRYLAIQGHQTNGMSSLRKGFSGLLHSPPQHTLTSAREIHAIDLRDGALHLVGVRPGCRFKYSANEGFIDGGKRILINNYIWKFPGRRPWAMTLLLPSLLVAAMIWAVKRCSSRKLHRPEN